MEETILDKMTYVETYIANHRKKGVVAYLLWFFLGGLGAHRFYMGKPISGLILLIITLFAGWFTLFLVTGLWLLVDLFLISGWLKQDEMRVKQEALMNIAMSESIYQ